MLNKTWLINLQFETFMICWLCWFYKNFKTEWSLTNKRRVKFLYYKTFLNSTNFYSLQTSVNNQKVINSLLYHWNIFPSSISMALYLNPLSGQWCNQSDLHKRFRVWQAWNRVWGDGIQRGPAAQRPSGPAAQRPTARDGPAARSIIIKSMVWK